MGAKRTKQSPEASRKNLQKGSSYLFLSILIIALLAYVFPSVLNIDCRSAEPLFGNWTYRNWDSRNRLCHPCMRYRCANQYTSRGDMEARSIQLSSCDFSGDKWSHYPASLCRGSGAYNMGNIRDVLMIFARCSIAAAVVRKEHWASKQNE